MFAYFRRKKHDIEKKKAWYEINNILIEEFILARKREKKRDPIIVKHKYF